MLTALIMAGGKGTRFWPLSTDKKPKQFLNLIGKETMIQMTVNRIKPIIPIDRIFVCTGEMYVDLVKEQLPELPQRNIIIEPEGRNTTPCIALSAFVIRKYYKDANMIVLPSDHLIQDEEVFRNIILKGNEFISNNENYIVTLGIKPSRAETGYGYIKCSEDGSNLNSSNVISVEAFVEKPNKEKAQYYVENGNYLWNGGMFIWSTNNILDKIRMYSPATYEALKEIDEIDERWLKYLVKAQYAETEGISIDYAVLEKDESIVVIPADFGWDDVGSWEALDRYREKDAAGNVYVGNTRAVDGMNNLIISSNNSVVVEGLSDIYVIEHDGKILVGRKSNVANVKELKKIL